MSAVVVVAAAYVVVSCVVVPLAALAVGIRGKSRESRAARRRCATGGQPGGGPRLRVIEGGRAAPGARHERARPQRRSA